jgi:regulation of enolase protein 1 (concanavalin A-like superfamily)
VSHDGWLTVTAGASGMGNGNVTVGIAANSGAARSGTVTIAGQTFTVTQDALPACSVSLSSSSQSVGADAESVSVGVTSSGSCTWTAVSRDSWLTVTSGASGTGNGTVAVGVSANGGGARNGSVAIGNQLFNVSQAAAPIDPNAWSHQDIGAVGVPGDATFDTATSVWTVTGAGADVWGSADALHFAYRTLTGDGRIVARVTGVQNSNAWAKAGVMIRETLDAGSAQAFMLVSFSKGLAFQRRELTGGTSVSTSGAIAAAPYWVMLDRIGNTLRAYQSADGVLWTLVDSDTIAMAATVNVGIGVSSHTTTATAAATFDNVSIVAGTPAPPATFPAPWVRQDIGAVGASGGGGYDIGTDTFTVKGAGADVWGTADALHYVYRPLSGDGSIVARVASVQNVNAWTKAGVMIRETLTAGSTHAFMVVSPGKGLAFQRRPVTGGASVNTAGAAATAPYWVRLDRNGNLFTAYQSTDGVHWAVVGTETIVMDTNVFAGLAVSSHTTATAATATFDHVQ